MTPEHHTSGGSIGRSERRAGGKLLAALQRRIAHHALGIAETNAQHQYVARPPEMSYVAPVENEHSSLASQQISAATSSAPPIRPIGIFSTM